MSEVMLEETARRQEETEERLDRLVWKLTELEDAGHWSDAARVREIVAVITETRDALRLRLRVAGEVMETRAKWNFL